jgi:hypothetical protein
MSWMGTHVSRYIREVYGGRTKFHQPAMCRQCKYMISLMLSGTGIRSNTKCHRCGCKIDMEAIDLELFFMRMRNIL